MKKSNTMHIMGMAVIVVVISLFSSISVFAECAYVLTEYGTTDEFLTQNPTADALLCLENPTPADFAQLSSEEQQLYLTENYQQELAYVYLQSSHLIDETDRTIAETYLLEQYDSAIAKTYVQGATFATQKERVIAEQFFSESNTNVNENKERFEALMVAEGVTLELTGAISGYQEDGTLTCADATINIKKLKTKYDFKIDNEGTLIIKEKKSGMEYPATGDITVDSTGRMQLKDGMFGSYAMSDVTSLFVDSEGNIHAQGKKIGDLEFATKGSVVIAEVGVKTYYYLKDAQLKGLAYSLTGAITVDETNELSVPKGYQLTLRPTGKGHTTEEKIQIKAYQDDVALTFGDATISSFAERADVLMKDLAQESVVENRVTITNGIILLEAEEQANGKPAYRVEVGHEYFAAQAKEAGTDQMLLPEKGNFVKGDHAKPGDEYYEQITAIQSIVGVTPDGDYGKGTEAAVRNWQNAYNEKYHLKIGDPGFITPTGNWDGKTRDAYLLQRSTLALEPKGGYVAVTQGEIGLEVHNEGNAVIDLNGVRMDSTNGQVNQKLMDLALKQVGAPVKILNYDSKGEQQQEFNNYGSLWGYNSFGHGLVDGTVSQSCVLKSSHVNLNSYTCMATVSATAWIGAGYAQTYGADAETYNLYAGVRSGTKGVPGAWHVSHYIREEGGSSLYYNANAETSGDKPYDFGAMEAGDVLGIEYPMSQAKAWAESSCIDEGACRTYTHVATVVDTQLKSFTYNPEEGTPRQILSQNLGVQSNVLISNYPLWITEEGELTQEARMGLDGKIYRPVDLDSNHKPKPGVTPLSVKKGSTLTLKEVYIYEQIGPKLQVVPAGKYFSNSAVLAEHLRPNEQKRAEVEERFGQAKAYSVSSDDDLLEVLRQQGISEEKIPAYVTQTKQLNNVRGTIPPNSVIYVPRTEQDLIVAAETTTQEQHELTP